MMQSFGLQPTDLILVLLLLLNALTFVVYGVDKWRAQGGRWRIPERTLLLLAAFWSLRCLPWDGRVES